MCFVSTTLSQADRVRSDISLIHPNNINRFLTTNKTHHRFRNQGNKGGLTALCCHLTPSTDQANVRQFGITHDGCLWHNQCGLPYATVVCVQLQCKRSKEFCH